MITDKEKRPTDIRKRTFSFALDIVHLAQWLEERPGVSWVLGRQTLGSGESIGANVERHKRAGAMRMFPVSMQSPSRRYLRLFMLFSF